MKGSGIDFRNAMALRRQ